MGRWLFAALVLVTGCSADEVEPDLICTLAGCDSYAGFKLGVFPVSEFQDVAPYGEIDFCLNAYCRSVMIDAWPENGRGVSIRDGEVNPGPQITVGLLQRWSSDIELSVGVRGDNVELFHDGDVYRITFKGYDGHVSAFGAWSVDYKLQQPNGGDCEPTCRSAMTVTPLLSASPP